ncbi:1,5-anhydro-D-fructose reductase-like isoform X3 [Diabrotica virgifera virgifera]|uniref:NADP-dependent oxidoreductase domain-containing protein n=1 Tax=Diabrotica virgifera virgifera TaxID=50390 RepID=A0ABM5KJ02_DIAVI|nr:1,5-anhydro-D-fructose reductase-like isoform X3 [Diabrotica virgifera virgifera]
MAKTVPCGSLNMPTVGLGTWQATDEAELEEALNVALQIGYRHIDTEAAFENEHVIGKVLDQWISAGKLKREDLFIVTKLPMRGIHRDRVEKYLTESLKKLGLDYVDLYLIHFPVGIAETEGSIVYEKEDHVEIWKSMEKQVEAGRTKTIGLSNFTVSQIDNILKNSKIKPSNNQVELHVFLQQPELVQFCQKNGISVTACSPLGSPGMNTFLKKLGIKEKTLVKVLDNPVILDIAKKHNKKSAQVALRFLLQQNIVVIPKSVNPERLKSNFDIFNFYLDDEDMTRLRGLEVGEDARMGDWKILPGLAEQPAYPFRRN